MIKYLNVLKFYQSIIVHCVMATVNVLNTLNLKSANY